MLSNCGSDEYGRASGGQAGDQTGREYRLIPWYNGNWTHVFRYPDAQVRNLISRKAIQAAVNDLIGYDQGQRLTFWQRLKESGYDPSKITVACESDCSASTAAIIKAVGIVLNIQSLAQIDPSMSTWIEVAAMIGAGFQDITDPKYRTSEAHLLPGDILLKYGHTCIEVGSGNINDFPEDDMPSVQDVWNYDGAMNKVNEINSRSNEILAKLSDVLALVVKPSVIVDFGGDFHRLYNLENGDHYYTNDSSLIRVLISEGWKDDGVIFTLENSFTEDGNLVYMMVNQLGDTLFTANVEEANNCANNGWATCGPVGYHGYGKKVYRLYNPFSKTHLFTSDGNEYNTLVSEGWNGEGVAFESA